MNLWSAAPATANSRARSSAGGWLVTFADLLALLIAFFVMLFAMSVLDQEKWNELRDAITDRPASAPTVTQGRPATPEGLETVRRLPGQDLDYLASLLPPILAGEPLLAGTRVTREASRLIIALPGGLLFEPGAIELRGEALVAAEALAVVLGNLPNRVEVQGHADPRPVGSLPSNWELSLGRAAAVAAIVEAAGHDGPVPARGLGASRYDALPGTLSGEERLQAARRVEIIVHSDAGERPS